jgi:hypothetical protein
VKVGEGVDGRCALSAIFANEMSGCIELSRRVSGVSAQAETASWSGPASPGAADWALVPWGGTDVIDTSNSGLIGELSCKSDSETVA